MSLFDENSEVLRELASKGSNLTHPRRIDFAHAFPDHEAARRFAEAARHEGFETVIEPIDREANPWDAIASKVMLPTCENITEAEEALSILAQEHGGLPDGWGFWSG